MLFVLGTHAINGVAWHDSGDDGAASLEEFVEGFALRPRITHRAVEATPERRRKLQLHGAIEDLEDLPPGVAQRSLKHSLKREEQALAPGKLKCLPLND